MFVAAWSLVFLLAGIQIAASQNSTVLGFQNAVTISLNTQLYVKTKDWSVQVSSDSSNGSLTYADAATPLFTNWTATFIASDPEDPLRTGAVDANITLVNNGSQALSFEGVKVALALNSFSEDAPSTGDSSIGFADCPASTIPARSSIVCRYTDTDLATGQGASIAASVVLGENSTYDGPQVPFSFADAQRYGDCIDVWEDFDTSSSNSAMPSSGGVLGDAANPSKGGRPQQYCASTSATAVVAFRLSANDTFPALEDCAGRQASYVLYAAPAFGTAPSTEDFYYAAGVALDYSITVAGCTAANVRDSTAP